MKNQIKWKKGIFKRAYQVFSGQEKIGELKPSLMTLSATGKIDGSRYKFSVSELSNSTAIINMDTKEVEGSIKFSHWLPKATIHYKGERYTWKLSNLWETRWKITNSSGNQYNYAGWSCSGKIDSALPPNLLSLTGLFISNYYWQMSAIMAAAFIPILISAL